MRIGLASLALLGGCMTPQVFVRDFEVSNCEVSRQCSVSPPAACPPPTASEVDEIFTLYYSECRFKASGARACFDAIENYLVAGCAHVGPWYERWDIVCTDEPFVDCPANGI